MHTPSTEDLLRSWVDHVVVGLNLCPFAAPVVRSGELGVRVSEASDLEGALEDALNAAVILLGEEEGGPSTLLVAFPEALASFEDYLDVVAAFRAELSAAGADGVLQVATFHPQYRFDGVAEDDVGNWTNRAPFPVIHLLREEDVERAIAEHPDPEGIPAANIAQLKGLGVDALRQLWASLGSGERPSRLLGLLLPLVLLPLLSGCPGPAPFQEMIDQGMERYLGGATPQNSEQADGSTLHEFALSDGPMCLRGAPFRSFTRSGTREELLIYLQGGGACWSELCIAFEEAGDSIPAAGILDPNLAANPVADWNLGYVPYCDGSLFVGDAEVDEDGDGEIDRTHRGLANLSAALEAIHAEFPDPPQIVLSGISAGAYGTILAGALARSVWPDVPIDVVADGGVGLGRPGVEGFITGILGEWDILSLIPPSCTDCFANGHATELISWALERDPTLRYAGISSLEDTVISTMFLGIGGPAYRSEVRAVTGDLAWEHPGQFARFIYEGSRHTTLAISGSTDLGDAGTLPFDVGGSDTIAGSLDDILGRFDVTAIGGVTVADWLSQWIGRSEDFESLAE
jgi:hypothetical protein